MWKDSGRWTRQSKSKHSVTELLSRAFIEYFDRIWWYYCRHPHRRCRQQFLSWTSIRFLYRVRCDGGQLWRENSPHIRVPLVGISESDTLINKHNAEIWSLIKLETAKVLMFDNNMLLCQELLLAVFNQLCYIWIFPYQSSNLLQALDNLRQWTENECIAI